MYNMAFVEVSKMLVGKECTKKTKTKTNQKLLFIVIMDSGWDVTLVELACTN